MVYSGKPSAACVACKQKKIRCDEARPTCGPCIKYRRDCAYTYTDRNDILFQNESTATIRQASKSRKSRSRHATPAQSEQSPSREIDLIDNPPQSVDTAALAFYLDGMIITPASRGRRVGHLEFLPRMYLNAASDSALASVTRSTCLAAFSCIGAEDSVISQTAFEAYGKSVTAIYRASKDPALRTKTETLMAILLMLVNECLLARHQAPSQQWSMHIFGAMQLIILRGPTLFDDPIARRLYLVTRSFLLEGANYRDHPLHPFFNRPEIQTIQTGPEGRLGTMTAMLYHLRPRVLLALANESALSDFLLECRSLDRELEQWSHNLPEEYRYTTVDLDKHQYLDAHNHRLWNNYRCSRIFANALEYRCLQKIADVPPTSTDSPEAIHCLQNLQTMADEISASIPDELRTETASPKYSSPKSTTETLPAPFVQSSIIAWYLIWPLYLSRGILSLPTSERDWFRSRMVLIADKYRFRQALHLVHISDENPLLPLYVDSWDDDRIENVWEKILVYGCGSL